MSGVKIQINSLEALNRLIGDNSEMELEVKNAVIQSFAKTFIKAGENEPAILAEIQKMRGEALAHVQKIAEQEIGLIRDKSYPYRIIVSENSKELIRREAKVALAGLVDEYMEQIDVAKLIDDAFTSRVNREVDKRINTTVRALIESKVNDALRDILK